MSFCVICSFRRFYRSQQINQRQQHFDLTTELEDSRKFALNSLTTLLAFLAISGSKALQPVVLTFFIYTISLRLAMNTCFLQNHPIVSRFLHAIPLVGTLCMAVVTLISDVQSPALAAVGILLGVFPLVTFTVHHGGYCAEMSAAGLPMRVWDVSAPASSTPADTPVVSN